MDQIHYTRLSMIYAGCFLGAGYVSGQELWQYFGTYGIVGYLGLIFALLILAGCGLLIIRLVQLTGITEPSRLMVMGNSRFLRFCVTGMITLLMFAVVVIMTAGVGALLEQLTGISSVWGSLFFSILVLCVSLAGINGLIRVFSSTVPVLIICTLLCGVLTVIRCGLVPAGRLSQGNSVLGTWYVAAVNFASYNILGTIPILAPISPRISNAHTARKGIFLGVAALLIIALSVLLSISVCVGAAEVELPMLYAASQIAPWAAFLYALLLFAGMFGTGLSSFVGFLNLYEEKYVFVRQHRVLIAIGMTVIAFGASLAGFGNLIGTLYPLFGYSSLLFLLLMLYHYLKIVFRMKVDQHPGR